MNTRNTHRCFVLSIIALNASLVLDARAQNVEPELVQPGVISLAGRHETFPAQDPIDGSLWFSTYSRGFAAPHILRAAVAGVLHVFRQTVANCSSRPTARYSQVVSGVI